MAIASPHSIEPENGHSIGSFLIGLGLAAIVGAVLAVGTFVTMFAVVVCQSSGCL